MPAEFDKSDWDLLYEGSKEIGSKALEYLALDFLTESKEEAPVKEGGLVSSIEPNFQSDYQWIIGANIEYAADVHEGHVVAGPLNSDRQRKWWFATLKDEYGGEYTPKVGTGNKSDGNPFFDRALDTVEGNLEEYIKMATEDLT